MPFTLAINFREWFILYHRFKHGDVGLRGLLEVAQIAVRVGFHQLP